jgi:hypothetical protein
MWVIETTDTFDEWFDGLDDTDRANVLASLMVLRERPDAVQTLRRHC